MEGRRERREQKNREGNKKIGKEKRTGEREKIRKTKKSRTSQIVRTFRSIKEKFPIFWNYFTLSRRYLRTF